MAPAVSRDVTLPPRLARQNCLLPAAAPPAVVVGRPFDSHRARLTSGGAPGGFACGRCFVLECWQVCGCLSFWQREVGGMFGKAGVVAAVCCLVTAVVCV